MAARTPLLALLTIQCACLLAGKFQEGCFGAELSQPQGTATTTSSKHVGDQPAPNSQLFAQRWAPSLAGQSVLLHCLVDTSAAGDAPSVSWFRGAGELQLLTFEQTTIIQDERFIVRHAIQRENDWALQIKNLDKSTDAGLYQCQTSGGGGGAETPQSQFYQLNIVEPQVSILGAPDLAVRLGAPISLSCVISQTADQMQFIFWYRDERMINYDLDTERRGKIVVSKAGQPADGITSRLQIHSARPSDSGNYTCQPSGARSASVYLHVLEANDKRLIMFQNDDDRQAASSQHQTSSAVSLGGARRADSGQAYALFLAFLVLASWFNLVAQAQTGVSLALLAVIGLLVGRLSELGEEARHQAAETGSKRRSRARPIPSDAPGDEPLLERANDAINLLRSLNSCASEHSTTCSALDSSLGTDETALVPGRPAASPPLRNGSLLLRSLERRPAAQQAPSPASTSSASSSSTGYNSADTGRPRNRCPQSAQLEASHTVELLDERGQPATALRLVLQQLDQARQRHHSDPRLASCPAGQPGRPASTGADEGLYARPRAPEPLP